MFKRPVNLERNAEKLRTLYAIQCGEFVKVGITSDLTKRLFSLQAGNPHTLTVRMARTMPAALALQVERKVHDALAEHAIGREWFRLDASIALAAALPIIAKSKRAITQWVDPDLGIIPGSTPRRGDVAA